jgi:hypothetical protein
MSSLQHTMPVKPTSSSSKTAVIVAGSILGLLIVGGIVALVYFLTLSPTASSQPSGGDDETEDVDDSQKDDETQDKTDSDSDSNDGSSDDNIVRVGDTVYLRSDSTGIGLSAWVYVDGDASANTYLTADPSSATAFKLVSTPNMDAGYTVATGDKLMMQSYGLKDFGDGTIDAAGTIALQVASDSSRYLANPIVSDVSCNYEASETGVVGLALVATDASYSSAETDYQWVDTYGTPSTSRDAGTTGSSVPSMGFVEYGSVFQVRPSYTRGDVEQTMSESTSSSSDEIDNICGGHQMMALRQTSGAFSLGWLNGGTPTDFYFERAS